MIRRFLSLLFVAGASGSIGVWVGLLFAPAPGAETRASIAAFFDEHDQTIADYYDRGRETLGDAVDAVSVTIETEAETDTNDENESEDDR